MLPTCDKLSHELMALEVGRPIEAKDVIRILGEAVLAHGRAPEFIRSDNWPEFGGAGSAELDRAAGPKRYTPWQSPYSESFNNRFWVEFLDRDVHRGGPGS